MMGARRFVRVGSLRGRWRGYLPATMKESAGRIELSSFVRHLRAELSRARRAGEKSDFAFEVGPIELELEVGVETEVDGEGGVKLWVFDFRGGASEKVARTQRVKVTLQPLDRATGKKSQVSGKEKRRASS